MTQSGSNGNYTFTQTVATTHNKNNNPFNIVPYVLPLSRVNLPIAIQDVQTMGSTSLRLKLDGHFTSS